LPEAAALREAKEETNLDMKIISLLGIYTDRYGDEGDYTLNFHYVTEIIGGDMQAQDDVSLTGMGCYR
jgi:ADP-ribose pyrophosphatase YjhB (NUDIX family)